MSDDHPRMARERRTVEAMIRLHCHNRHGVERGLCDECADLLSYASARLQNCPFGASKPTCARCSVHCYSPKRREQIRAVMRYAGPRMLYLHPLLAFFHLLDGLRKSPANSSEERAHDQQLR
jgi:predicted amidophosphoribosyltransferase